jgi:hypothetical protein
MVWSNEDLPMTLAVITIIFGVIAVAIVTTYSIVEWGQIGYTGGRGIVGLVGPKGIIGPDVATIIRSCFKETSDSPFVTPAVAAGEFNTADTILFDTTIIGQGDGAIAEMKVKIVNDNVDLDFDDSNEVKVTFLADEISMATFRVYKGVSANVLNLAIVNTSEGVVSTVLDVTHAPSVTNNTDISKSLWLSFKCDTAFKVFARTIQVPSKKGFAEVGEREALMEFV